jgi:hypothetical protein
VGYAAKGVVCFLLGLGQERVFSVIQKNLIFSVDVKNVVPTIES